MEFSIESLLNIVPPRDVYEKSKRFSASGLGSCLRKQLLYAHGIKLKETPDDLRKLEICSIVHEAVQKWVSETFEGVHVEVPISDEQLHIGGRIDILIEDNNNE